MAMTSGKKALVDLIGKVVDGLDEKSPGDKMMLQGIQMFCKGALESSESHAKGAVTAAAEEEFGGDEGEFGASEDGDFGAEETAGEDDGFGSEEGEFGASEEEGDFGASEDGDFGAEETAEEGFGDEEEAGDFGGTDESEGDFGEEATAEEDPFAEEAPAKPARGAKPAAPAKPADPFDGMQLQEIIDLLSNSGADMGKVKAAHAKDKVNGVKNYARQVNKLGKAWVAFAEKKKVEQMEDYAKKKGVAFKYGRGRSDDAKKKSVIADALAAKMIPVPGK